MASSKYMRIAKKLQTASRKMFGVKLLIDQRQWYHKDKDMAITSYTLYQVDENVKSAKIKLFQTYSQVQLVLFMRDLWYELNGWEVPTDNKIWEGIKRKYAEKEEPTEESPSVNTGESVTGRKLNSDRTAVCDELYTSWKCKRSNKNDRSVSQ